MDVNKGEKPTYLTPCGNIVCSFRGCACFQTEHVVEERGEREQRSGCAGGVLERGRMSG